MKHSSSRHGHYQVAIRTSEEYPWRVLQSLMDDHSYILTDDDKYRLSHVIRTRDFDAYLSLSEDWGPQSIPSEVPDPIYFRTKYLLASVLKKFRFPASNKSRRQTAVEKFLQAETKCKEYNENLVIQLLTLKENEDLCAFTHARAFLSKLLGEVIHEDALTEWSRHGPGSNLDSKGGFTSLYDKYNNWPYSCTSLAAGHAKAAIQSDERWIGALEDSYRDRYNIPKTSILNQEAFWATVINIVPGNRITFVPKNSLTDRSIAIEPCLNLYLQLGVDGFIRRRLKRWGVNLDDQSKNQDLAREGSIAWRTDNPFVTIDLAAASDTVSLAVCRALLPPMWYSYLTDLRSPEGNLDGEIISYEKISSMGNGYTFALESAIFSALVYGVMKATQGPFVKEEFAVYGDDIIVRASLYPHLVKMLNFCGFSTNEEKSFTSGPFRESCGADFFNGHPVRPIFLTDKPSNVPDLWTDYNRFQRLLWLRGLSESSKTLSYVATMIPPNFGKFTGPYSDEDFSSYRHVPIPTTRYKDGLWTFPRLVLLPKSRGGGNNFLFRKLMAPLRQNADLSVDAWSSKPSSRRKLPAGGNVFALLDNRVYLASESPTQTSIWSGEYTSL